MAPMEVVVDDEVSEVLSRGCMEVRRPMRDAEKKRVCSKREECETEGRASTTGLELKPKKTGAGKERIGSESH